MANIKICKDIQQSRITAAFSYVPKFVVKVKSIEGHRWHPDKKEWSFPYLQEILKKILEEASQKAGIAKHVTVHTCAIVSQPIF